MQNTPKIQQYFPTIYNIFKQKKGFEVGKFQKMLSVKHTVVFETYLVILFCFSEALPFYFPVAINEKQVDSLSSLTIKENNSCVALRDCPTYAWLLRNNDNKNQIIQITPSHIIQSLRIGQCVMPNSKLTDQGLIRTGVLCPEDVDSELDYDYSDYDSEATRDGGDNNYSSEDRSMITRSAIDISETSFGMDKPKCSLEMIHGPEIHTLYSLRTKYLSGSRKKYKILRNLEEQRRTVVHMSAHGSCCWDIYSQRNLRGDIHRVAPGDFVDPNHQPRSIQRVICNT